MPKIEQTEKKIEPNQNVVFHHNSKFACINKDIFFPGRSNRHYCQIVTGTQSISCF